MCTKLHELDFKFVPKSAKSRIAIRCKLRRTKPKPNMLFTETSGYFQPESDRWALTCYCKRVSETPRIPRYTRPEHGVLDMVRYLVWYCYLPWYGQWCLVSFIPRGCPPRVTLSGGPLNELREQQMCEQVQKPRIQFKEIRICTMLHALNGSVITRCK